VEWPSGGEAINLGMQDRALLLHSAIMADADNMTLVVHKSGSDWDSTFTQRLVRFGERGPHPHVT
jgi:hypothetical protein